MTEKSADAPLPDSVWDKTRLAPSGITPFISRVPVIDELLVEFVEESEENLLKRKIPRIITSAPTIISTSLLFFIYSV